MFGISKKAIGITENNRKKGGMRDEQERKSYGCAADSGKGSAA